MQVEDRLRERSERVLSGKRNNKDEFRVIDMFFWLLVFIKDVPMSVSHLVRSRGALADRY